MSDKPILLPDWSVFEHDYIRTGIPQLFVVRQTPAVTLFIDQGAERIGVRFEQVGSRAAGQVFPFAEIHVGEVASDDRRHIEIWTDARHLFGNFYRLIAEIVVAVVEDGMNPDAALADAVERWETLISRPSLMSEEAQAGLFGELWLLERLVAVRGIDALDAWVGPLKQPHDFRLGNIELEVKTTSGAKRIHTINGVGQLEPSLGCSLYLLSLKLANAGTSGRTLPEAVSVIECGLTSSHAALTRFRSGISSLGYDPADAPLYSQRRRLRDTPVLIPVCDGVPRLTTEALAQISDRFATTKIGRISYSIDVDGFGFVDGTEDFHAIVPAVPGARGAV
ncbi:hypothetical protein GCM10011402_33500 [Paracoccus acridae]|uniref:PD-(D/E)XK motif protein n=1 Tax=Paracoccus acridae TaxID=1795310 RepID=A0ABQ1VLH5_9RHOB|nr:PD-(D/E)XK motif protein [Paracoccus acridae]GGF78146.1 hypothetical protein GCM10011402_33500 [Paracoccus acridae]